MKIMEVYNIRLNFIHPSQKTLRRQMREIPLFAMDARKNSMQLMVKGVSYDVTMLCISYLRIRTGHIALYARFETKLLYVAHYGPCTTMTIYCVNL